MPLEFLEPKILNVRTEGFATGPDRQLTVTKNFDVEFFEVFSQKYRNGIIELHGTHDQLNSEIHLMKVSDDGKFLFTIDKQHH